MSPMTGSYILCREVEDLDRKARSSAIIAPVMYRVTGDKDRDTLFIAQALEVGEGLPQLTYRELTVEHPDGTTESITLPHWQPEAMVVAPGELLLMNLYNVSYRVHRAGRPHFVVQNRYVCGVLDPELWTVRPMQNYVLLAPDPEAAQKAMTGSGMIWLSEGDSEATDHVPHGQGIMAAYGRVVAAGPGRWDEGRFVSCAASEGDLVLFDKSHSTLDVTLQGRKFCLVDARQIVMVEGAAPPTARSTLQ